MEGQMITYHAADADYYTSKERELQQWNKADRKCDADSAIGKSLSTTTKSDFTEVYVLKRIK